MSVWGVLLTAGADPSADGTGVRALRDCCDGVVVVSDCSEAGRPTSPRAPTRLEAVSTGLASLPDAATVVVLMDDEGMATAGCTDVPAAVGRLSARVAAVVRVAPVTDALKRLDGDEVAEGIDRAGLFAPRTPQVFRRDVLEQCLAAEALPAHGDPAVMLVERGVAVDLLHQEPTHDVRGGVVVGRTGDRMAGPQA